MTTLTNANIPSARKLAYQGLYEILEKNAYSNLTIQQILKKYPLKIEETNLLTELIYGVLRRYNKLTWIISQLSKTPLKKIHPSVRILLCIALYQLLYLDRIPESAAVNESVKIAKKITHRGNVSFINGVLRNFLRQKDELEEKFLALDPLILDSLTFNEPEWLINEWKAQWGTEESKRIFEEFNKTPKFTIRLNLHKESKVALCDELKKQGVDYSSIPFLEEGLVIKKNSGKVISNFLKYGKVYIQSVSSMIPPKVLGATPADKVLDMCAAPGSKTTQIGIMMKNEGYVEAWDIYPHKVSLIGMNAKNLGLSNIHPLLCDGTIAHEDKHETFDKILLDAPCSGLGVLGHKPEIRWTRTKESLSEFVEIQKKLLLNAAKYLKPNGTLVYSTCTLNKEENEHMIQWFLAQCKNFKPLDFSLEGFKSSEDGMMTIFPYELESDGFFVAKLKKGEL